MHRCEPTIKTRRARARRQRGLVRASLLLLVLFQVCALLASLRTPTIAAPATGHPRLFFTPDDVTRLRSWAVDSNPFWSQALLPLAENRAQEMDEEGLCDPATSPDPDGGGSAYVDYPTESYAMLFAFLSMIDPSEAARADWAVRGRQCLLFIVEKSLDGPWVNDDEPPFECAPYRCKNFATSDRSRWFGEGFGLAADWLQARPAGAPGSLSAQDLSRIRAAFLRYADANMHATITTYNNPYYRPTEDPNEAPPRNSTFDERFLNSRKAVRFSGNNYYTAHFRNLTLFSLALDPEDDPDGELRGYLDQAVGAWLYTLDNMMETENRGGVMAEGFEYAPQTVGYLLQGLLALRTSGTHDPALWGGRDLAVLENQPFWDDFIPAFVQHLSPRSEPNGVPDVPEDVYRPAWYGDGQRVWLIEPMEVFGPLALYDRLLGNEDRLEASRWIQTHLPPGGPSHLLERAANPWGGWVRTTMYYFTMFEPGYAPPDDPRPSYPLDVAADGVGRITSRTDWGPDANWFIYSMGWNTVDHQHADNFGFELWRKGEWLTKQRVGYGDSVIGRSDGNDYKNSLSLQNEEPAYVEGECDYRREDWRRGTGSPYGNAGEPGPLRYGFGPGYVYADGEGHDLYNNADQDVDDIRHASRSIVWLKPDHIVMYDRATSATPGRFKRWWMNLTAEGSVAGNVVSASTPGGQRVFSTTLLPAGATPEVSEVEHFTSYDHEPASERDPNPFNCPFDDERAVPDPITHRIKVEAPGHPADARFLHVVQGADGDAVPDAAQAVASSEGTAYTGAAVAGRLVMFKNDFDESVTTTSYTAPPGITGHYVTGLDPDGRYAVEIDGNDVTVTRTTDGGTRADDGGLLSFGASGEPLPSPSPSPQPTPTSSPTPDPTASPTPDPTASPTPEPTGSPTPDPTASPGVTPSPTPSATTTPTPSTTPTATASPSSSPNPSPSASPATTPSASPAPTSTPGATPSATPANTPAPTLSPAPTPTPPPAPTGEPVTTPTASPVVRPGEGGQEENQLSVEPRTVGAGGRVSLAADGFAPRAEVALTLRSHPVSLGTVRANGDGGIRTAVTVPARTHPGTHRVIASGLGPDGGTIERSASLTVTAGSAGLPQTGGTPLRWAFVLLGIGTSLVLAASRGVRIGRERRRRA